MGSCRGESPLLCPDCRLPIDPDTLGCQGGHHYALQSGVLSLLAEDFAGRLADYLPRLSASRAELGRPLLDEAAYERLPDGQQAMPDAAWRTEWRLRCHDLAVVQQLLGRHASQGALRILDVGAWNGWLSHRLAALGHAVTAVDYFVDEHDGLGARRFYTTTWRAIQLDLRDLSVLDEQFDVVILNRCLQFFSDPIASLAGAQHRVAPGGQLIVTGLQRFRDSAGRARQVQASLDAHRQRFGFDLLLFPAKGCLDGDDTRRLRQQGLRLHDYPRLRLARLRAMFDAARPRHCYGVWHA
jgi:SAM-dependent methyltransferase